MDLEETLRLRRPGEPARLVVGTMNFGKRTPAAEAEQIISAAIERGLRWFDTANVYNDGESERILGRAVRARRGDVFLATKCGIGKMSAREGLAAGVVARALDESLQRLGTDYVDLYYLHSPDPKTPVEETLGALEQARAAGKIRAWAVSNYASWQIGEMLHLCKARGWQPPRVSQVIYNLLVRQLDIEYFAFAKHAGLHTTVYNPLAGGLLAGKPGARFEFNPYYKSRYLSDRFFELTEAYGGLAREASLSPVELAYAWIAQRPGVDSILLGPASLQQLEAGVAGCQIQLSKEVVDKIDGLHRQYLGTDATYAR